ncbi:MAG: sugar phosphate isomerase/epimerase family protein [Pseudomonadota bacterium]
MRHGFGVHSSLWGPSWTPELAAHAIDEAKRHKLDILEIALLAPASVDAEHTRGLFGNTGITPVCSLTLPGEVRASRYPDKAVEFLTLAIDKTADLGGVALCGVTYGLLGERTNEPPTEAELDNVAKAIDAAATHAAARGIELGLEAVNRYETHLLNTAEQTVRLIERVGQPHVFVHLDTYHMNIEENGVANGIIAAGERLKYIHLSESHRGVPGTGTVPWDEIFGAMAAIGFQGGMVVESFINLPPEIAAALSVWRPVADSAEQVMAEGVPFLHNKAKQYGLVG